MNVTTSVTTIRRKTIRINRTDIIDFLLSKGEIGESESVKKVYVAVPGGASWSNTDLEIEHDDEVIVQIEETFNT